MGCRHGQTAIASAPLRPAVSGDPAAAASGFPRPGRLHCAARASSRPFRSRLPPGGTQIKTILAAIGLISILFHGIRLVAAAKGRTVAGTRRVPSAGDDTACATTLLSPYCVRPGSYLPVC